MRTKGNKDVFAKTNVEVVLEAEGKWDRAQGLEIAENWFQTDEGLDAIICNNDEMAIGALLAAQGIGIADEESIIYRRCRRDFPMPWNIWARGLMSPYSRVLTARAMGGAEAAYKILKGEMVDKMYWKSPLNWVTAENMADYL